jgi:hypothetical protein
VHLIWGHALAVEDGEQANVIQSRNGGVVVYDPPVQTFATSAPTTYAPSSWYNVNHYWTAASYTYSSYIFLGSGPSSIFGDDLDVVAKASFSVEFYSPTGTYLSTVYPVYNSSTQTYIGEYTLPGFDYYIIIRNLSSSSILSNAYYCVF